MMRKKWRGESAGRMPAASLFAKMVLVWLLGCLSGRAGETADIDDCQYADDAAARAAWQPMRGSLDAATARIDGRKALRLGCNFADTHIERASWDRAVQLDLASARGIEFQVRCRDASPVSHFSIYFQSGSGWYHATFFPESATNWNTIVIDKTETQAEGKPAGWGQIKTIRISAWRGEDRATEFYLRDLRQTGALGADATVAILRSESAALRWPEQTRGLEQAAETVAQNLSALGIGCAVLSDLDVTAQRLRQAKLVILPFNPSLPEPVADALGQYLGRGGKLLAFYTVPGSLLPVIKLQGSKHVKEAYPGNFAALRCQEGLLPGAPPVVKQQSWNINAYEPIPGATRVFAEWLDNQGRPTGYPAVLGSSNCLVMTHILLPNDPANKRRLLLSMAGSLVPALWQQAAQEGIAQVGKLGGFTKFEEAVRQIGQLGREKPQVAKTLAEAQRLRDSALKLAGQQQFPAAMEQAQAAQQQIKAAFCQAQQPLAGEFRAFWCHSAFGVDGISWEEAIQRLADNGFTAILPNLLWGGAAFYPSQVLPVAAPVAARGDQLAQCLAACRKHGLQVHVWKVNWNLGSDVPKEFVERMRREKRLQVSAGSKEELWLCPSHPDNQQLEIASLLEVVRNYDVDGIHFDYIRYPDGDHCFCAGCKERFQRDRSLKLTQWPGEVLADGPVRQQWLEWRRSHITAVVKTVSEQVRAMKPTIKLSAAVFRNWPADRDSVGQDWKLWCERGYLDFVCPMDYTSSNGTFENMVARQVQWAGRTPCYPGIGVSASSSHFGVDRVIEQIQITRRHGTHGFVIFNYGVAESQELLPALGQGITAKSARPNHRRARRTW